MFFCFFYSLFIHLPSLSVSHPYNNTTLFQVLLFSTKPIHTNTLIIEIAKLHLNNNFKNSHSIGLHASYKLIHYKYVMGGPNAVMTPPEYCHWRELQQVLFLLRQNKSIIFVATKQNILQKFCHNKNILSQQT